MLLKRFRRRVVLGVAGALAVRVSQRDKLRMPDIAAMPVKPNAATQAPTCQRFHGRPGAAHRARGTLRLHQRSVISCSVVFNAVS